MRESPHRPERVLAEHPVGLLLSWLQALGGMAAPPARFPKGEGKAERGPLAAPQGHDLPTP